MIPEGEHLSESKYNAIYRIIDEQVGQFCGVISVIVKKEVA